MVNQVFDLQGPIFAFAKERAFLGRDTLTFQHLQIAD